MGTYYTLQRAAIWASLFKTTGTITLYRALDGELQELHAAQICSDLNSPFAIETVTGDELGDLFMGEKTERFCASCTSANLSWSKKIRYNHEIHVGGLAASTRYLSTVLEAVKALAKEESGYPAAYYVYQDLVWWLRVKYPNIAAIAESENISLSDHVVKLAQSIQTLIADEEVEPVRDGVAELNASHLKKSTAKQVREAIGSCKTTKWILVPPGVSGHDTIALKDSDLHTRQQQRIANAGWLAETAHESHVVIEALAKASSDVWYADTWMTRAQDPDVVILKVPANAVDYSNHRLLEVDGELDIECVKYALAHWKGELDQFAELAEAFAVA